MLKGDVLLVYAKFDPVAWLIRRVTKSQWNHVALVIDESRLIEARGTAVSICPVTKYTNWKYNIRLMRFPQFSRSQLQEVVEYVTQFQSRRSYWRYVKTLLHIICFGDYTVRSVVTCSGLLARGFENIGYKFANKNTNLITPEDIANSSGLNVTFYLK